MTKTRELAPKKRAQLIRARKRVGRSGVPLAKKLRVAKSTVYRIEAGLSHPSLALMQRWTKALGPGASMDLFWAPGARARPSRRVQSSPDATA
jgi:DNA-binding XRE family transcriptional regulator